MQFWIQPFALLLLVVLLWSLLPASAVLFKVRLLPPLPDSHVRFVELDSQYASEIIRVSMQAWRRSAFGDATASDLGFGEIDPFVSLDAPVFLESSRHFPSRWQPGEVTPLAAKLPDLLYAAPSTSRFSEQSVLPKAQGLYVKMDATLESAGFQFPPKGLSKLSGAGSCRVYVECDDDGKVVHVVILQNNGATPADIERTLQLGGAVGSARGEILFMWRK